MLSGWGRIPSRATRFAPRTWSRSPATRCSRAASAAPTAIRPSLHPAVLRPPIRRWPSASSRSTSGPGRLRAEAGLSVFTLNRLFRPRGFVVPVSPGHQFVTLGGMVAADVHGASHHVDGCFGAHVMGLRMRVADGRILECGPEQESELFWATVGGMGLTGHILEVEFRMRTISSPWLQVEKQHMPDIDAFMEGLKASAKEWPQTKGWIDCLKRGRHLGRGVLMRARWASAGDAPAKAPPARPRPTVPFELPFSLVTPADRACLQLALLPLPVAGRRHRPPRLLLLSARRSRELEPTVRSPRVHAVPVRAPAAAGTGAARRFLELLTRRGGASMLCVIKDCGPEGKGLLSFPKEGISIALDIPVTDDTQGLVDALNEAVIAEGGRVLPGEGRLHAGRALPGHGAATAGLDGRAPALGSEGRIRSAQSVRLFGDAP